MTRVQANNTQQALGAYVYDGEGKRVSKTAGGVTTTYVYDASGQMVLEDNSNYDPTISGTRYFTSDHLGSTRLVMDSSGQAKRYDYLPFGEELIANGRSGSNGYGASGLRQKFTGKERDAESSLDYFGARYFGGAQGRFTGADFAHSSGRVEDPQTWNRYAYGRNNPIRFVDPDGNDIWDYLNGMANAVKSNSVMGIGRESGNVDFQRGQRAGDLISVAGGIIEMAAGGSAAGGGSALCGTGVGCLAGAPAVVAGPAVAAHGATLAGRGAAHLMESSEDAPQSSGSEAAKAPGFIVSEGGDVIPIPDGASGPSPVVNPQGKTTGSAYKGGSGGKGLDRKVSDVRIMDPTPSRGSSPGYPNGYVTTVVQISFAGSRRGAGRRRQFC